jgi:hypothetical protein
MLLLGSGLPATASITAAIALFTLAEPLFHTGSRLGMFNLRQLCWTTGEALGALSGGTAFLLLYRNGHGHLYWLALGGCAVIITQR